jgi:hypothetical protein
MSIDVDRKSTLLDSTAPTRATTRARRHDARARRVAKVYRATRAKDDATGENEGESES